MADLSFLDWPFFETRHRALAAALDDWAVAEVAPLVAHPHESLEEVDELSRALVRRLGAGGWLRHCVPAAYGGAGEGFDVRTLALIRETLARHAPIADFAFAMQGLGSGPITLFGDDALKADYLPAVATGERICAFALSEPQAGSDVAAIACTATADGDAWVLNGTKTWISNAGLADQYVVFVRTGEAPGAKGLSAFIVDADAPGLHVPERIETIAPHPLGTLTFDGCRVPASKRLGRPGDGFKIAMATLDVFRATVGAAALGCARRALDAALDRAGSRQAFGRAIAEFQAIQLKLADMALAIDAAALMVYRAAWAKDAGAERVTREASMAKLYATEAAQQVIDQAVQIFGGQGVVKGETVEALYREIRALRIYEGTSEIQKLVIARLVRAARAAERPHKSAE